MLRRALMVAIGCLLLATAAAGPAVAVTNEVRVSPLGQVTSPATANISGTARCDGGVGTVTFSNPTGTPYVITSTPKEVVCDGVSHPWAHTITSPTGSFKVGGTYLINAVLVAPSGTIGATFKVTLL